MSEHWDDPDAVEATCIRCGERRPCLWRTDPYLAEVWPDDLTESDTGWWCWPCFDLRAGDV